MGRSIGLGRIPGPLGVTFSSGITRGFLGRARVQANIATKAGREFSKRIVKLALRRAGSRLAGKMVTGSKAWERAFVHIAEHFNLKALTGKATHTVFVAALRTKKALEPLIAKTVKGPSKKYISRATVSGVPAGRPAIIMERIFDDVIGETFSQVTKSGITTTVKKGECKILRVIVDVTGKPITAYPIEVLGAP